MTFPGATADRAEAAYVVIGAPLDVSTSFQPGTRFGPRRVRTFGEPFDDYDRRTDQRFSELGVADAGDIRAWDDAVEYLEYLAGELRAIVESGAVPAVIGGEHTVSIAGIRATAADVYVCLDAHLDLRESFDGNAWSHACTTRRVLEVADEAIILGARTGSRREWERADDADVTVVSPEAVPRWTAEHDLDPKSSVYLSVDIDAADPSIAPGTGTMEPFGLDGSTLRDVVRAIAPMAVGCDVVEVNDRDNGQSAALAAKLLREFVFAHAAGSR